MMIDESPWRNYRGKDITAETLAFLLEPFAIKPARNRTQKERGYYIADFIQPWKRAVKLEMPSWMEAHYGKKFTVTTVDVDRIDTMTYPCVTTPKAQSMPSSFQPF